MYIGLHVKYRLLLLDFIETCIFLTDFRKMFKHFKDFMKIRPVGAELFHADGRIDITKVTVAIGNFASAPKMALKLSVWQVTYLRI
jgi:hypothetical protein